MIPQAFRRTEFIHRTGLAANKPAVTDVLVGTLYFSTDTSVLERNNGITWESYSGGSSALIAHHTSHETGGADEILFPSGVKEHGRTVPMGEWIDVPYDAADFSAKSPMIWTVQAADVINFLYMVIGKTLFVNMYVDFTSVGGTLTNKLYLKIPGGYSAAHTLQYFGTAYDNGILTLTSNLTRVPSDPDYVGDIIEIRRFDDAIWSTSVNNTYARLSTQFPIL